VAAQRIGIFGGTFDPIHVGHLVCAQEVAWNYDLDRLLFMVCGKPALKDTTSLSDAEDRYWMCCLATADNPTFEVSRLELERIGTTYTIDTLRELQTQLDPEDELFFIMGADALRDVPDWKDAYQVGQYAHFVVATRPGTDLSAARELLAGRLPDFHYDVVELPAIDLSSRDIRRRVADGQSIRYLLPEEVEHYVRERELYC